MQTARATLTLAAEDDFEELLSMYTEPDTLNTSSICKIEVAKIICGFLKSRIDLGQNQKGYYWVARHNEINELIGAMNLTPFKTRIYYR